MPIIFTIMVLLGAALGGCSFLPGHESQTTEDQDLKAALEAEHAETLDQLRALSDPETAWPSVTDCDATLWACVALAGGVHEVQYDLAEYAPGEIHRRPAPACYPNDEDGNGKPDSRSTVSKDMLTGYVWCAWAAKDPDALARLADYGEDHDWIMGEPVTEVGNVFIGVSNLPGLIGRALYALTEGADDRYYRRAAPVYPPVQEDFQRHVQTQAILLHGEIAGEITDQMLTRLQEHLALDPDDYLIAVAVGIYTGDLRPAGELLLSDPPAPSYVRGDKAEAFALAHKAQALKLAIKYLEAAS